MKFIKEVYDYRTMLASLVRRDLVSRYKGSVLGFLWTFLNPLLQLGVFTLLFSVIMRVDIENFPIFLFIALVPWFFISSSINVGTSCIIANGSLVTKIYFPRLIIPLSAVTSQFCNMCFSMVIVLLAVTFGGVGVSVWWLLLPVVMIIQYLFVLGLVLFLSALNVYLRDLQYIFEIVVMAWFYITPIVYTVEMIPENIRPVLMLNPATSIVMAYRDILFYRTAPDFSTMAAAIFFGLFSTIVGALVFQKLQRGFAEEL